MRKFFLLALPLFFLFQAEAATTPFSKSFHDSAQAFVPVAPDQKTISLARLSALTVKELEALHGKKLSFFDKIHLKLVQKKLRNSSSATVAMPVKEAARLADGKGGFHLGGFVLGFFGLLPGVLVAYLIKDEKKSNRVKWAWIGFSIPAAFLLLFTAVTGGL